MKKIVLSLVLLFALLLTACGEYIPPVVPSCGDNHKDADFDGVCDVCSTVLEKNEEPPADDGSDVFTVTVMKDGSVYKPAANLNMRARWSDGRNTYTANVNSEGVAEQAGLDGDYTVTLLGLPVGYTYNPNIYKASNDKKDVKVEIIKISYPINDFSSIVGTELYTCYKINKSGTYRAEIDRQDRVKFYEFTPTKAGVYHIESIADISSNMYNPIVKIYTGTTAAKFEQDEIDGGGASNTYTTNFLHIIKVDEEFLGNTYTFGIRLEGKDATYPAYVDFTLTYKGDYEDTSLLGEAPIIFSEYLPRDLNYFDIQIYNMVPEDKLPESITSSASYIWYKEYKKHLADDIAKFGSTHTDAAIFVDNKYVFTEEKYKYNPEDGYYHVYDPVKYALYGGWGPILYADISTPCKFIQSPLSTMEYAGNKALTVENGTENYKLFVEGSYELTFSHGDSGPYFCNSTCDCYKTYLTARNAFTSALTALANAKDTPGEDISSYVTALITARNNVLHTNGGACDSSCTDCNATCRRLTDDRKFSIGYANVAQDGRVPVTEEMKVFLQKLSESQKYFSDGNGWVETQGYTAFETSQWLFACGYYE